MQTQVLGLSVDSIPCLKAWAKNLGGITYPLLSDFYSKYNPLNSLHGLTSELMRVWVTTFGLYGYPYEDEDEEGWEEDLCTECHRYLY